MKEVSETALEHVMLAHPKAWIEDRQDSRVLCIPCYDINTDRAWIEERKIVNDPSVTPVGIVPVFNLRKGAKFNPGGDVRTGLQGQLYRILGYSPPDKDSKD